MIIVTSDEKYALLELGATYGFSFDETNETLITMDGKEYDTSEGGYVVIKDNEVTVWEALTALQEYYGYI